MGKFPSLLALAQFQILGRKKKKKKKKRAFKVKTSILSFS